MLELVREIVMQLSDVEEGTIHGEPAWRIRRKLLACPALHKSAEPNSLVVSVAPEAREQLLSSRPDTYYLPDHYRKNSVVLIRLSKIDHDCLKAVLELAWEFVSKR
jgi:hypothetical protein